MRYVGVVSGLLTAVLLTAQPAGAGQAEVASKLPKLYQGAATDLARHGLIREFPFAEDPDYRDLDCNKRLNRVRFKCEVSFFAGDSSFNGSIKVRYILKAGNRLGYRYAIRVLHTDTYCLDVRHEPREQCQDVITKKGNGYA